MQNPKTDEKPTPRDLMRAAMRRQPTERIPTMPQICHDTAIRLYESVLDGDWLDGLARCIEDPALIYDYVIRLVEDVDCDGIRLFVKPEPMKVRRIGDQLIVVDQDTGERIGRIDTMGGGGFVPDKPPPPVETLAEAKERLDQMVRDFTDAKLEMLQAARARVPHRFVAAAPGGITMNTYTTLRGRVQGMLDFL